MKTLEKKLSKKALKEDERKEVMTVNIFLTYFDLFTSKEVDAVFLEDNIDSYITYFFSNN